MCTQILFEYTFVINSKWTRSESGHQSTGIKLRRINVPLNLDMPCNEIEDNLLSRQNHNDHNEDKSRK